ncbi:MAG TPA: NADH-quinone oxidoreductase subunit L [Gemmatimonadales bacterium]|jgi:NADH-quinone oxidoreductase subunit L
MTPVLASVLAQAIPLGAGALILLALRRHPASAAMLAIVAVAVSCGLTLFLVSAASAPGTAIVAQRPWLPLEAGPGLIFGVLIDPLSSIMSLVVTSVTLLVMIYSLGYMAGDKGYARYFGLLSLFAAAMLGLVLASNLLQLLVFWELVGLASFLLIGFWFERPGPAAAARKAFIMTRVGDVGFLLGVLLLIRALGNVSILDLVSQAGWHGSLSPRFLTMVSALLLMGAAGKSAQGPLFTWLPDAMEGPTPVSALLHSATMVAAGVYLVARLHGFFAAAPSVMHFLLWMSLITAVAAATMAMVAEDIKRVLAYSSISQLAYMFMALAAGSVGAGFFHLITHAGFKALLFLAAGIFIHHAHSNSMREIARHGRPRGRAASFGLIAGAAALAGVIPFSGYFSKEAVLASLGPAAGSAALILAYGGAFLTAYYAARMVFLTLTHRPIASPSHGPTNETTLAEKAARTMMAIPVLLLGALTLVLGWLGASLALRFSPGVAVRGALELGAGPLLALGLAAAGILLAWLEYGRAGAARVGFVERVPALRDFFANNWYLDRLYAATFVRAAQALSRLARWNDQRVLDGAGDTVAAGTVRGGRTLSRIQNGQVQMYLAIIVTVLVAFAFWLTRAELLL